MLLWSYNHGYIINDGGSIVEQKISAGQFKAKCLQLMEDVKEKNASYIITKRGIPIAKLVPLETSTVDLFGAMKGSVKIKKEIISPINEEWDAE
ncbi:MAG TPA: type II toxin-antitoxin system prevent-host-death family antitoxin [Gammaproteobacteria bacterium]|jgi:prevent-host-death family protein|nr:type II toxin-antitoxin system prevent-host-death family antitoxin [Gammaproteobacteria bacterium]